MVLYHHGRYCFSVPKKVPDTVFCILLYSDTVFCILSGTDEAIVLAPPFLLTIERGLEVMADDEYLEITPHNVRLRKQYRTDAERAKARRNG